MAPRIRRAVELARTRGGGVLRRAQRALGTPEPVPPRPEKVPVVGMVEQFSQRLVVGWISVPKSTPPVAVTLHLGPVKISSTYATPNASMSGAGSVLRGDHESASGSQPATEALVHPWQVPNIPGPRDDRRNSRRQIRTFSFRMRGIWPYVKRSTRITVRVDGEPLPIFGHGMFLRPPRNGKQSLAVLREKLDHGYLFSQKGALQLSKQLDEDWQGKVMKLYQQTREILLERFGYDVFFIYGTLLGAVREGGYIGHDGDFDAAYVSRHTAGADAAAELQEIALVLIEQGMDVQCMTTALHIHDSDHAARIDLFHTFFNQQGELRFPFGIAGTTTVTRDDWQGTREVDFPGGKGLVPVNGEQVVEMLYGVDWRKPKPGFNWNLDRTSAAREGNLSADQRSKVYWANFYARTEYSEGSTFFEFVNSRPDTPRSVVDIGCGDGRDACAFGASGRAVLGLDQSPVGIDHARKHAAAAGLEELVSFQVCDVGDADTLGALIEERVTATPDPLLFYLRFFLHSIPQDVQERLMKAIDAHARPGDVFAAEFRTDKDEAMSKVHGKHYRRFQNGAAFGAELADRYGFALLHEEERTGLSPYKGEDPFLYRVIARR